MVREKGGYLGLVLNLENTSTGIVMFQDNIVMSGDLLTRTHSTLNLSINHSYMGSAFDPVGTPLSFKNSLDSISLSSLLDFFGLIKRPVELKAPGIIMRQPVYETLPTGITAVDAVFPIGLGQRELIIGDRQTGKTSIASDTFLNQSALDFFYVRFGSVYDIFVVS